MFDLYLFFLAIDRRMRTGTRSDSKWALRFFIFSFFFACSSKKMACQQSRHIIRWRPIRWNPLRRNRRTKSDSGLNFFFFCGCCFFFCVFYWQKGSLVHVAEHAWIDCVCALGALLFSFFLSFFFFCIRLILLFPFCCCVFASHSFSSFECYWVCL